MRDEDIHIGDTLRIRSYEDMKSEFGADEDGDIVNNNVYFITSMIKLCGREFTVSDIMIGYWGRKYKSFQGVEERDYRNDWIIVSWMLEPCEDDVEFEIADDNEIALLFS